MLDLVSVRYRGAVPADARNAWSWGFVSVTYIEIPAEILMFVCEVFVSVQYTGAVRSDAHNAAL